MLSKSACEQAGGTVNEDATDPTSCNQISKNKIKGCCKKEDGCTYTTGEECLTQGGQPYANADCTRVSTCKCNNDQPKTACVGDEVFSYDSCDDPKLLKRCDTNKGEHCADSDGDGNYDCEDMNCKVTYDNPIVDEDLDGDPANDGGIRQTGESWCEYQSAVGPGLDLPGTAHYLHGCEFGREIVKECGQARSQLCGYFKVGEETNYPFLASGTVAKCFDNEAEKCIACNDKPLDAKEKGEESRAECCSKAGLCQWQGVGKSEEKEPESGIEFYFMPTESYAGQPRGILQSPNIPGKLYILDKVLDVSPKAVKLIFINNKNEEEFTKSLEEAEFIGDETTDKGKAYNYILKVDLGKATSETYKLDIEYNGQKEFLTTFDAPPTLDEQGMCLPIVPPGNIPIKKLEPGSKSEDIKKEYAESVQKADEECDKASQKEIPVGWKLDFGSFLNPFTDTKWNCKQNCEVYPERDKKFMYGQNYVCGSFGDCGAKWNVIKKWSSEGFYFDCGDLDKNSQKKECHVKKYKISTPPEEFKFENFMKAGKGFYFGELKPDLLFSHGSKESFWTWSIAGTIFPVAVTGILIAGFFTGISLALQGALLSLGVSASAGVAGTTAAGGSILAGGALAGTVAAVAITAILVVAIGVALFFTVTTIIKKIVKMYEVRNSSTSCNSWQPPKENECWRCHTPNNETNTGETCEYISGNCGLIPIANNKLLGYECTPQMCSSLGKDCTWHDTNKGARCIEQKDTDVTDTRIKIKEVKCKLENGGDCAIQQGENPAGIQGTTQVTGEIKAGQKITIEIQTLNPADNGPDLTRCKYSLESKKPYDEMDEIEGGFGTEHTLEFNSLLPGEHSAYLACEDVSERKNEDRYVVKFTIAQYPDPFAPVIQEINTPTKLGQWTLLEGQKETAIIPHGQNSIELEVVPDEKTKDEGCRWTFSSANVEYDKMDHSLRCAQPSDPTKPYACTGTVELPPDEKKENPEIKIWIRCIDEKENKALQSTPAEGFKIKRSGELKINDVKCTGPFSQRCDGILYDKEVALEVYTQGGVDSNSECKWNRGEGYVDFLEGQGTSVHRQPGYNLVPGDNSLTFTCKDKAGNIATNLTTFKHEKDEVAPKVLKVYREGNQLTINTDEYATCKYATSSSETLDFTKEENSLGKNDAGNLHTLTMDNNYYRIGCSDRYGNVVGPFNVYTDGSQ